MLRAQHNLEYEYCHCSWCNLRSRHDAKLSFMFIWKADDRKKNTDKLYAQSDNNSDNNSNNNKKVKEEKMGKNTSNPIELMKLKVAINEPSKCKNLHCHGSSVALQKLSFFHSLTRSVVRSFDCLLAHVIIELRQPVKTFTTLHLPIVNK